MQLQGFLFKNRYWLFLLTSMLLWNSAKATHLVGGSITYKFISRQGQYETYEILVSMYRDCNSQTPFDNTIEIGFYEAYSSTPELKQTLTVAISSLRNVDPPAGGSECSYKVTACLQEGLYKAQIQLPVSTYGYFMEHLRCCRNTMTNVPDNEGFTYYGFIPPSGLKNTSPTFNDVPAPYICAEDTVQLVNSAKETDGDSLVYKLAIPYTGGTKDNPSPGPPQTFTPPTSVNYNWGYSYLNPFGKNGYVSVDSISGITTVYAPTTGLYVFAIEVDEYRAGKLISITRRDIQVIVTKCPVNPQPKRESVDNYPVSNVFNITAGDTFHYTFGFTDPDGLGLTYGGDVLDASKVNPAMTIKTDNQGTKVIGALNWVTACNQASSNPYTVTLKAQDKGCPPKITTNVLSVYVKPFKGADRIFGPKEACWGDVAYTYTGIPKGGGKLRWEVQGGTLLYDTGKTVKVIWNKVTSGTISMVEISKNGCPGDTVNMKVNLYEPPVTSAIAGAIESCAEDTQTYTVTASAGSSYTWGVENGRFIGDSLKSTVDVAWGSKDTGTLWVVEKSAHGCPGDTVWKKILISNTKADTIYGSLSVCPNASNIDYWVRSQSGSVYHWDVTGGTIASGDSTWHIKVNWGEKGGGTVKVVEITHLGCVGDTLSLNVLKDYILYTPPIVGDSQVCEFVKGVPYQVVYSNGSKYDWKIVGGTIVSGTGTNKIYVDWDTSGTGILTLQETAFDPVNHLPCVGIPVAKVININKLPHTKGIFGPTSVCAKDTSLNYYVQGYDSSIYFWYLNDTNVFAGNTLNDTIHLSLDSAGTYKLKVLEMTKDSCTNMPLEITINVHPLPKTSPIQGPDIVCLPYLTNHTYHVNGYATSTYQWKVDGGVIKAGQGTPTVTVNWQREGRRYIWVNEITEFGCMTDSQALEVQVDSLHLDIDLVTTSLDNDRQIELHWTKKNGQFLNRDLRIYRSINGKDGEYYDLIDSVPNNASVYIDKNVHTDRYSYRYKIAAMNSCGTEISSTPHRSILLQGTQPDDSTVSLVWNRYSGWDAGVGGYSVFRNLNDTGDMREYQFLNDSEAVLYVGLDGFRQCFRIGAVKADNNSVVSYSNRLCFDFDPFLYIPNAFTPDHNELNEYFKIFVSNYKSFQINIYNRWGEHIFTSDSPDVMWDGTFHGTRCPQDVYLYRIVVKGSKKNIFTSGTVHLIW